MSVIVPTSFPYRPAGTTEVIAAGEIRSLDMEAAVEGAHWLYAGGVRRSIINFHVGAAQTQLTSAATSHADDTRVFIAPFALHDHRKGAGLRVHYRINGAIVRVRIYDAAGSLMDTVTISNAGAAEGASDSSALTDELGWIEVSLIAHTTTGTLYDLMIEEIPLDATGLP